MGVVIDLGVEHSMHRNPASMELTGHWKIVAMLLIISVRPVHARRDDGAVVRRRRAESGGQMKRSKAYHDTWNYGYGYKPLPVW